MNLYKFKHFYLNKYIVTPISGAKYYLSYNYKYHSLWFRTYKVASRTINQHFVESSGKNENIYSSKVGYIPAMFTSYFKFAFVRNPIDKFLSAWKQKVLMTNSFRFTAEEHEKMKDLEYFLSWVEKQDVDHCDEHLQSQNSMIDLDHIDFIGRFENFEEDFKFVSKTIGLPYKALHHSNKSVDLGLDLKPEIKERIRKFYARDFELFYKNDDQ